MRRASTVLPPLWLRWTGVLLAVAVAAPLLQATGGVAGSARRPARQPPEIAPPAAPPKLSYRIGVQLDPRSHQLHGRLSLRMLNHTETALRELRLHLYLNAFASTKTLFWRSSGGTHRGLAADRDGPGWIRIEAITADGRPARARRLFDGTVAAIALPVPLPAGRQLELKMRFSAQLPRIFARTGYADDFHFVAQWYPKLAFLRDDGTWQARAFHVNEEFFARFADYRVAIELPRRFAIGATGTREAAVAIPDGRRRVTYSARRVVDFAFAAWPDLSKTTRRLDDVEVELLSVPGRDDQRPRQLALIREGLHRLQRWLGRYPYARLSVVDVPTMARGAGGMEYPTLFTTWIPSWAPRGIHAFDELTLHELTHQYFQGLVATNEVEHPWLDEGVTTYVSATILDELFGADRSFVDFAGVRLGQLEKSRLHQLRTRPPQPIGQPARSLGERAYGPTVYGRTAALLYAVESLIGKSRMLAALGRYVRQTAFSHPDPSALRRALRDAAPEAQRSTVEALLAAELDRGEPVGYALRCSRDAITALRRGRVALPLQIEWHDDRGRRHLERWDGRAKRHHLATPGLRRARLGPARRLGLDDNPLDDACEPAGSSASVALRALSVLQQALQLVGP